MNQFRSATSPSRQYSEIPKDEQVHDEHVKSSIELQSLDSHRSRDNESNDDHFQDEEDDEEEDVNKTASPSSTLLMINDDSMRKAQIEFFRSTNLAIPLNYFLVGLVQGLTYPLLNVYSLDLGATEAQQLTLMTLKGLPSCFKIGFGFWSDNVPLFGYRRKPYLYLGWAIAMMSLLPLLIGTDLTLTITKREDNDDYNHTRFLEIDNNNNQTTMLHNYNDTTTSKSSSKTIITVAENAPTMPLLCSCFFVWACGVWLSDVMGDSLVAEKAKFESNESRGDLQVGCYILRGFGMAMMAPLSTVLYNTRHGPYYIILATMLLPLLQFPWIYLLYEKKNIPILATRDQITEIWNTVCSRRVWQPMGFVYIYLVFYISNSAWKQFLESVVGFTPTMLNAIMMLSAGLAVVGAILYKLVLNRWSWRTLFFIGILLNGVFTVLQILLIRGQTFGISPFLFSLGDEAMMDFILGTQYLPTCVLMVNLVPSGIEGASYALFTTTWNAASSLSDSLSTMMLGIWDVSKPTLESGDLSGMIKLTLLTSFLQSVPIFFVWMLPNNAAEIQTTSNDACLEATETERSDDVEGDLSSPRTSTPKTDLSRVGGAIYLGIVLLSVVWAIFVGVMNTFKPGWIGESR